MRSLTTPGCARRSAWGPSRRRRASPRRSGAPSGTRPNGRWRGRWCARCGNSRPTPATPMDAAMHVGAAIVDGDFAGRAIPELCQTSAAIAGMSFAPGAIVDPWGNVLLVKQTASELLTERIGKLVSIATKLPDMKASCAHAGFLMSGKDLKRVAVPGGITRALAVGRAIRAAKAGGADPVAAAAEALGGWVLSRGRVGRRERGRREGYM